MEYSYEQRLRTVPAALIRRRCAENGSLLRINLAEDCLLTVLVGRGRGCTVVIDGMQTGIWITLRGRLRICGHDEVEIPSRACHSAETYGSLRALARGNALWVALIGNAAAWQSAFQNHAESSLSQPCLLPVTVGADAELRRAAMSIARPGATETLEAAANGIIDRVFAMQNMYSDVIARCPGRSYAKRRLAFLRLQRVRNYLSNNCHLDLDIRQLAGMASYSPGHFVRAFRCAYHETPHAYLIGQRLQRARQLLRSSPLAIGEVAYASGFENRSAFARTFRQRFGTTAGDLRKREAAESSRTPSLGVEFA
jgi:AraC family transcriptional regulator